MKGVPKFIQADSLVIPSDRMRRQFDDDALAKLAGSIARVGLIHAPCLRDDGKTLLAGERRVRAIQHLHSQERVFYYEGQTVPPGFIPYTLASELSEQALLEAELEENVLRESLSWQEHSAATERLHKFRQSQGKWTVQNTASEILGALAKGSQVTAVSEELTLAKHLADPDVAKAKTKKDALKVVRSKANAELNAKLAKEFDLNSVKHIIRCGDMFEQMASIEDESVDVLCTDPPYGIDANTFGDQGGAHEYEDSFEYFQRVATFLADESMRVCKPDAHAYVFCHIRNFAHLRETFANAGWYTWMTPLIWNYSPLGLLPQPDRAPRRCYDCILFCIKGDRRVLTVAGDVISVPAIQGQTFSAEKPIELWHDLLSRSVRPGNVVLDPFAGVGNILFACDRLSCSAITIERDQAKYDHSLVTYKKQKGLPQPLDLNSLFKPKTPVMEKGNG